MEKSIQIISGSSADIKRFTSFRKWIARSVAIGVVGLFSLNASAQMASGTYTVDPNSPNSSTNFTTIQGFFTALTNNSNAIAQGGARLEIYPGTYTEQITIPNIAGLGVTQSGTDRLVITSHSSGTAKVQYSATSSYSSHNGAVFFLNNADYISFVDLEITNTSTTSYQYAWVIQGYTGSDYITVDNCVLKAGYYNGSGAYARGVAIGTTDYYYPSGGINNGQHYVVKNSSIEAYYGAYFYGYSSSTFKQDFSVTGNTFNCNYPMYTYYVYDVEFSNNIVASNGAYVYYGIYMRYTNNITVIGNDISNISSYPIYAYYINRYNTGVVSGRSIIANNMIHSYNNANTYGYGGYFGYVQSTDVVYNSINAMHANGSSLQYFYGIYLYYDLTNSRFQNNVIKAEATSTLQYLYRYNYNGNYNDGLGINYNTFYSETAAAGNATPVWYWRGSSTYQDNTLANHISNTSQNANSQVADPGFIASDDLHVNGVLLYQKGTAITSVTTDYDGTTRPTTPSPGIHEYTPKDNDAGVVRFDDPVSQCADTNDIIVTVRNYAKMDLDSFEVHYSYVGNGGANGNGMMKIAVSPSMKPGADTTITVGQVFMTSGAPGYDFKAWTMKPNGVTDEQMANDSSLFSTQTAMIDTFTIGGTPTPDFATFTDAVFALGNYGICGPVVFNVRDGVYPEQVMLSDLNGTSSTNTVLFREDPNNTGLVEIEFTTGGSSSDAAVVKFNNASYVTFDGINIENKSSAYYSSAIQLDGNSSYNSFLNGIYTIPQSTGYYARVLNVPSGKDVNYNTFDNNEFYGGYMGFYFYGDYQTYAMGNVFTNNYVADANRYGGYFYYQDELTVTGNEFEMRIAGNATSSTYSYAMVMYAYNANSINVSDNYFKSNGYGVQINVGGSRNVGEIRVVNNKFHTGDTTNSTSTYTYYGLYYNGGFGLIAHNLILREKNYSSGGYTVYLNGGLNDFYNNLVVTIGSGTAMQINGSYAVTEADNNAYVMIETTNGKPSNGLSYMTAAGYDDNGLEFTSAIYADLDSLYTCFDSLVGMGVYLSDVPVDMDGIGRNVSGPTIGPNEYTTPDAFTIGDDFNLCSGDSVYVGQEVNGGTYSWSTGDTTGLILVTMPGTYTVNMTGGCGAANGSVVVSAGEAIPTFSNTRSWLTAVFTNTSANADTYSWDFDDGSTSTDEHPSHLFPATGKYNVCLTATGECGSETTCQEVEVSDYVGITENALSDAVSIYPNPATDVLTINVDNVIGDELNIELSNIAGQVVITRSLSEFNGTAKEEIDVNDLTEGVYFVKVYTNEATTTVRVVVQK